MGQGWGVSSGPGLPSLGGRREHPAQWVLVPVRRRCRVGRSPEGFMSFLAMAGASGAVLGALRSSRAQGPDTSPMLEALQKGHHVQVPNCLCDELGAAPVIPRLPQVGPRLPPRPQAF